MAFSGMIYRTMGITEAASVNDIMLRMRMNY